MVASIRFGSVQVKAGESENFTFTCFRAPISSRCYRGRTCPKKIGWLSLSVTTCDVHRNLCQLLLLALLTLLPCPQPCGHSKGSAVTLKRTGFFYFKACLWLVRIFAAYHAKEPWWVQLAEVTLGVVETSATGTHNVCQGFPLPPLPDGTGKASLTVL